MNIHVLPGDALAYDFKKTEIDGQLVICRECLVAGDVKAENLEDFWQVRADFIADSFSGRREEYYSGVVAEFEKLKNFASAKAEINLWFEYELFCQVNMWFCLYYLRDSKAKIFRVAPVMRTAHELWKGFGKLAAEDLKNCFAERGEFSEGDILLGAKLWKAYQDKDYSELARLSEYKSPRFPYLQEVCQAEIDKDTRPAAVLKGIVAKGKKDFAEIFSEFSAQAGVYGFGDDQVKTILETI